MATTYPATIQTFTNPSGTSTLDNPDHATQHANENDTLVALQNTLGTTAGTSLFTAFSASDKPAKKNNETFGTPTITGGTVNSAVIGTPSITGGTANNLTLGTPIIGTVTVPGTSSALGFSGAIAPGEGTLTDSAGGTLTANAATAQIYYCAMGTAAGNRTVGTPVNPTGYQTLTYAFKASGSANGTLVWASSFRLSQDTGTPALGTGTTWNYFGWRYNSIDAKWDFMGQSKNII